MKTPTAACIMGYRDPIKPNNKVLCDKSTQAQQISENQYIKTYPDRQGSVTHH